MIYTSAGLSSTTAITSRGYGVAVFMAMTFPARLTTQHTLKYTAIALDMAEPAKLLPTGRDAAPQGPPARVVTIRSLKVSAVWRLWEVSPETTAPLTDLEQMAYGVTNQQVTENGVSFDLGVLDHFRPHRHGDVRTQVDGGAGPDGPGVCSSTQG
jgi:hypothetical protein